MAIGLYVAKDIFHVFQFAGVRPQLAEGGIGVKRNGSQRRSQLMGYGPRDSFHAQEPISAFASLQSDGTGEARIK